LLLFEDWSCGQIMQSRLRCFFCFFFYLIFNKRDWDYEANMVFKANAKTLSWCEEGMSYSAVR